MNNLNNDPWGIDFQMLNSTDTNGNTVLDIDLFNLLDGDANVVQTADFIRIFSRKGELDWDPDSQSGAGLLDLKGVSINKKELNDKVQLIDNASLSDSRIEKSYTSLNADTSVLKMVHNIKLKNNIIYSSNIVIGTK